MSPLPFVLFAPQDDGSTSAVPSCAEPVQLDPIPALRVHVDFPVDYRATINRWGCGSIHFQKVSGPPEFDLDGDGEPEIVWTSQRIAIRPPNTTSLADSRPLDGTSYYRVRAERQDPRSGEWIRSVASARVEVER